MARDVYLDYIAAKREAVKWARIALDNKRAGLPWQDAARLSHECLSWALLIIS